jgi:hypothetical protein
MDIKFDLQQQNGVKAYRIVNLTDKTVNTYVLKNHRFSGCKLATNGTVLKSSTFQNLSFSIENIL